MQAKPWEAMVCRCASELNDDGTFGCKRSVAYCSCCWGQALAQAPKASRKRKRKQFDAVAV